MLPPGSDGCDTGWEDAQPLRDELDFLRDEGDVHLRREERNEEKVGAIRQGIAVRCRDAAESFLRIGCRDADDAFAQGRDQDLKIAAAETHRHLGLQK